MKWKIYISISSIIVFLAMGFFYVRSTPHYSLYMLKHAIEKHDPDEALKYIHIDSIIDNLGRKFLGANEKISGHEMAGKPSVKSMIVDALPGIKDSIRSSVREAIISHGHHKQKNSSQNTVPNVEGNEIAPTSTAHDAAKGKTAVRLPKNQLFSIGGVTIGNIDMSRVEKISLWDLTINVEGKTAIVSIKDTPQIMARMAKTDTGHWQIVEILLLP